MSSILDKKFYLQLWTFTTGPAIKVMQLYFEVKILHNTNFEKFLNDQNHMHILFHQCFPTTPCCRCSKSSLAGAKKRGCLILPQFLQLYDNSNTPHSLHNILNVNTIIQHCLCQYSAKSSVEVGHLDITLLNDIIQHCCPNKMSFAWRSDIKEVRNFLAHVGDGEVEKADFEKKWKILKSATLGFASEIGITCRKIFLDEVLQIENSSIEALTEMMEKSKDDVIKKLDGLMPLKTEFEEIKTKVQLILNNQNDMLSKQQSSLDISDKMLTETKENKVELQKTTNEFREVKQEINNLKSFINTSKEKAMDNTKCKGAENVQTKVADRTYSTFFQPVKIERTEKYDEMFVDVDNLKCLLRIKELPNDLVYTDLEERQTDVKGIMP